VHVRPTVFLEGFFLTLTPDSVKQFNQIRLRFGEGKTSPIAADDVARVVAAGAATSLEINSVARPWGASGSQLRRHRRG